MEGWILVVVMVAAPYQVSIVCRIETRADARTNCAWNETDGWMEDHEWMVEVDVRGKERWIEWTVGP